MKGIELRHCAFTCMGEGLGSAWPPVKTDLDVFSDPGGWRPAQTRACPELSRRAASTAAEELS